MVCLIDSYIDWSPSSFTGGDYSIIGLLFVQFSVFPFLCLAQDLYLTINKIGNS